MANRDVRLQLFEDSGFSDRRIVFARGGIAVRDMRAFRFDNELGSFRLRNVADSREVTLILFADTNFRGDFRVFRGNTNVSDLGNFDDRMSSFIVVGRRLSNSEINQIRNTRRPPNDIVQVRQ